MILNRLPSRNVFPGQVICVPEKKLAPADGDGSKVQYALLIVVRKWNEVRVLNWRSVEAYIIIPLKKDEWKEVFKIK
jgi:hypothetical protein